MANATDEKQLGFFKACESGHINTAKDLVRDVSPSCLKEWRTPEERTCLHGAVLVGDPDLYEEIAAKLTTLPVSDLIDVITKTDTKGDTALHVAVRKNSLEMVKQLVGFGDSLCHCEKRVDAYLCDCANKAGETPLKLAVSLGFEGAVEFLITHTSNGLHYIVEFNQVKLVDNLKKRVDLSQLINQGYRSATDPQEKESPVRPGDTPLHIAARNKYEHMVNLLLNVPTVEKHLYNSEWKTPLDIAREVTEYYESFRTIKMLRDYQPKSKAFMYCVPTVSHEKYRSAMKMVNAAFAERRNSELVVAALLATMTFTAAIAIPGGFRTDTNEGKELGSPILIHFTSFKLFLIFNCIAFMLALFVCIMWQLASELTTRDKIFFMTLTSLLVCYSFSFTSCGFIAALYKLLARNVKTFAWVVLVFVIFVTVCGIFAFIYQAVRYGVSRARFHRLCGVPGLYDNLVISVWVVFERIGLLDCLRFWDGRIRVISSGQLSSFWDSILGKHADRISAGNRRWYRLYAKSSEHPRSVC